MKKWIFVLVFMMVGFRGAEAAPQCKRTVEAAGVKHVTAVMARHSAKAAWIREAKAKYGPGYSDWNAARRQRVVCHRAGSLTERCIAVGRPCRS